MTEASERTALFSERLAARILDVAGLDPASPLALSVVAAATAAFDDVEQLRAARRRCVLCGEPIVLCDADDPESWVHAEDAADWGDHSAEGGE